MSQSSYDRQMLIGVNRQLSLRPTEYTRVADVIAALSADPEAVSFMWIKDVGHNPRLRVIRVLWAD